MRRTLLALSIVVTCTLVALVAWAKLPEADGFSLAFQNDPGRVPSATADYLYNLPSGGHWLPGDRSGYDCGYTFLQWQGELVARVAFHRVDAASGYTQVNDRFMVEGIRYYDGELNTRSDVGDTGSQKASPPLTNTSTIEACITSNIEYPAVPPESLPVIRFFDADDGTLIETRDYSHAVVEGVGHFGLLEQTPTRTAVAWILGGQVAGVVYYTPLSAGVYMTTNDPNPPAGATTTTATVTQTQTVSVTTTETVTATETVSTTETQTVTVAPPQACGSGTLTLADGRLVDASVCA